MNNKLNKLEDLLGRLGGFIYNNPLKVIAVVLLLLAMPIAHITQLKMDTSTEGFMHDDDPVLLQYNEFRAEFGRDERVIVAIKDDAIFSLSFLKTLKAMHEEIEKTVPFVNDVTSLYNARNTRGEENKLITDDLLEPFPTTKAEVAVIKTRAMASNFYRDLLLSQDGKMTTIVIQTEAYSQQGESQENENDFSDGFDDESTGVTPTRAFLSEEENTQLVNAVLAIADKYRQQGLEIYVAGSPAVNSALKAQMRADIQKFMRITFLIIFIFLFIMFRRISATIYPLLVVALSLLATIGAMAWIGVAFKMPTQILPSLLLAVSVGATVHILSIFFDKFNEVGNKKTALEYALSHSGLAVIMTSVTTAIGIGSFAGSEVAPISDLGAFSALGVMISLLLTLVLLPAILSITKLKQKNIKKTGKLDHIMKNLATIPVRYYKSIIATSFIIIVISILAATKIELSHNPLHWFQPDNVNRVATKAIDKQMNGSVTIELIIDTNQENGWNDPQRLKKLNQLSLKLEQYSDEHTHVGKVISIATIVKETNRALHANNEKHYTIPHDANLVSQELLLFENSGSDDLEDVIDSQFSKARMTIKFPWIDAVKAHDSIHYVKTEATKSFPQAKINLTGMIPMLSETFTKSTTSSVQSYIIAFIGIAIMMMLILGSVRIGLLSMIPNLVPIIAGLFLMYVANIAADMFTLLVGSIAIGLAVDDTIHFMHNFRRYYSQSQDSTKAIQQTFFTTGKAMLITTIILSLGFYAYLMASMISIQNFGLLTGSVILLAILADLLLAPALMIVVAKWGWLK